MSRRNLLSLLGLGPLLAACNTLSLFNTFTPKESGVKRIARDIAFGADPRQTYDLYAPKDATGPLPVLVFFYGGGWNSGSKNDYVWMGHALAAMGYLVAIPDYRLVPQVVYPAFLDDNAAAIHHLMAHAADHGGNPARLGVCGHSAGAYAAVMMALDPAYFGPRSGHSAIAACAGISGPYDFYPFDVAASEDAFGAWPHPLETQPVAYAAPTNTAFLLMQSRADKIVGTRNAVNLEARLKAQGCDVRLLMFEDLSHEDMAAAFSLPFRGKGPLYTDLQTFLARTL
ncbi:alpha/beta hydrolase [Asticcacaulis sp. EMRT-3]|uniref:alpha/beta hydrolase n=1 Tax=Asticcacaulis sp. EMRT-3 TaxID=3040349 RepID=UPI0024AF2450|nr:alpha/beta hydrolase [Asticcacaulis sp. EMRT-3]MDI7775859.1 alpha/beta hydrolase [Asticcacaulis sp. EMRT-3]